MVRAFPHNLLFLLLLCLAVAEARADYGEGEQVVDRTCGMGPAQAAQLQQIGRLVGPVHQHLGRDAQAMQYIQAIATCARHFTSAPSRICARVSRDRLVNSPTLRRTANVGVADCRPLNALARHERSLTDKESEIMHEMDKLVTNFRVCYRDMITQLKASATRLPVAQRASAKAAVEKLDADLLAVDLSPPLQADHERRMKVVNGMETKASELERGAYRCNHGPRDVEI